LGVSGVGKTTAARQIARAYDLRLSSLDSQTYIHEAQRPPDTLSALPKPKLHARASDLCSESTSFSAHDQLRERSAMTPDDDVRS
jgi:adenylate kinase family enzyme